MGNKFAIDIITAPACDNIGKINIDKAQIKYKNLLDKKIFNQEFYCLKSFIKYNLHITNNSVDAIISTIHDTNLHNLSRQAQELANINSKIVVLLTLPASINFECEKKKWRMLKVFNYQSYDNVCPSNDNVPEDWKNIKKNVLTLRSDLKLNKFHFPKNFFVIYPHQYFCDNNMDKCNIINGEKEFNYIDDIHLGYYGSEPIVAEIKKIIESK